MCERGWTEMWWVVVRCLHGSPKQFVVLLVAVWLVCVTVVLVVADWWWFPRSMEMGEFQQEPQWTLESAQKPMGCQALGCQCLIPKSIPLYLPFVVLVECRAGTMRVASPVVSPKLVGDSRVLFPQHYLAASLARVVLATFLHRRELR